MIARKLSSLMEKKKMKRDLLIVSPYFPPSGAPTAFLVKTMVKAFSKGGCTVDVLAALGVPQPTNSHAATLPWEHAGVNVHYYASPKLASSEFFRKVYRRLIPRDPYCQCLQLSRHLRRLLRRVEYRTILSIADPLLTHEMVIKAARGTERLMFYFMDPVSYGGPDKTAWLAYQRASCESTGRKCAELEAFCLAPTSEILEGISVGAKVRSELLVYPHLFDGDDWPFPTDRKKAEDPITILHAGALYWTRRPDTLLNGFRQYRGSEKSTAAIHFLGSCAPEIAETFARFNCEEGVHVKGAVTENEARAAIKSADVLVIIDVELPRNVHLPSKVADYVGACKPILYIGRPDSPVCRLLTELHPAFIQANSPETVAAGLAKLVELARMLPVSAYRPAYESLEAQSALLPLIEIVKGSAKTAAPAITALGTPSREIAK